MQVSSADKMSEFAAAPAAASRRAGVPHGAAPPAQRFAHLVTAPAASPGRPTAQSAVPYLIQSGDTLSAIAFERLKAMGRPHGPADVARAVGELAQANGIANPDRIFAGQSLRLDVLQRPAPATAGATGNRASLPVALSARVPAALSAPASSAAHSQLTPRLPATSTARQFPVLERTLDRAVEQGFVPAADRAAVRDRIVTMAAKYRFSPDDFATVALMESNGLNPRASNGRCFGIIQFCGGTQAGAAAVGLSSAPQQILERPVLEQLDLVDQYFEHNGLQRLPQVGLVDLYLTVLTPAAREQKAANAPLPIPGAQARLLYENQDRSQPITRKSILAGLLDHARQMLSARHVPSGNPGGNQGGKFLPLADQDIRRPGRPLG